MATSKAKRHPEERDLVDRLLRDQREKVERFVRERRSDGNGRSAASATG
jgi:hypothetical protein